MKLLFDKLAECFLHHGSWKGYWEGLIQQFKPAWRDGYFRAKVLSVNSLNADMFEVVMKPEMSWPTHIAGQHIALTVEINGRLTTRIFTVACGSSTHQNSKYIRLITKVNDQGALTPYLSFCKQNQWVNISAPMGNFKLPRSDKPLLMIAGGSGITPFIAMLEDVIEKRCGYSSTVHLLYFAKRNEHVLLAELSALQKRCEHFTFAALTKHRDGDVATHLSNYADAHWLVCGPSAMFQQVETVAKLVNAPLESEHFAALPTINTESFSEKGSFSLVYNGNTLHVDNHQTLLSQLQQTDISVTYGCGIGICHQCQCVKKSGVVRDTRTGKLSDSAEELIQLCVSQAVTNLEIQL